MPSMPGKLRHKTKAVAKYASLAIAVVCSSLCTDANAVQIKEFNRGMSGRITLELSAEIGRGDLNIIRDHIAHLRRMRRSYLFI